MSPITYNNDTIYISEWTRTNHYAQLIVWLEFICESYNELFSQLRYKINYCSFVVQDISNMDYGDGLVNLNAYTWKEKRLIEELIELLQIIKNIHWKVALFGVYTITKVVLSLFHIKMLFVQFNPMESLKPRHLKPSETS